MLVRFPPTDGAEAAPRIPTAWLRRRCVHCRPNAAQGRGEFVHLDELARWRARSGYT
jgi:hypothetical protein